MAVGLFRNKLFCDNFFEYPNSLFKVIPINIERGEKSNLCLSCQDKHALLDAGIGNFLCRLFCLNADHKSETADGFNALCTLKLREDICRFLFNLIEKLIIDSLDDVACTCTAYRVASEG